MFGTGEKVEVKIEDCPLPLVLVLKHVCSCLHRECPNGGGDDNNCRICKQVWFDTVGSVK